MKKWNILSLTALFFATMFLFSCVSEPGTEPKPNNGEINRLEELAASLRLELADQIDANNVIIYRYGNILIVSMNEKFLFDGDSAILNESMSPRLMSIAKILKKAPEKIIHVVGHTAVWNSKAWPSSWDLGAQRAVNVVRFLQEKGGIDPKKMVAATLGEYQPIASNADEKQRQINRRVEIILMDSEMFDLKTLPVMQK